MHITTPPSEQRPTVEDENIYHPEPGELVKVKGMPRATFTFNCYEHDNGGDYAVVVGGKAGHKMARYVTLDRIQPIRRGRRRKKTQ